MRAVYGGLRSHTTLQAKREMVLGAMEGSSPSFPPPEVSVTTKSMGLSVERPICNSNHTIHPNKCLFKGIFKTLTTQLSTALGFQIFHNLKDFVSHVAVVFIAM